MLDLHTVLSQSAEWNRFLKMAEADRCHSLCFLAPEVVQRELAAMVARSLWGDPGAGEEDLLFAGQPGSPPGIEECRALALELSMVPVSSAFRVGVILSADRLSLPAANSLLKLTEEPPPRAKMVLLAERDNLIPTLRSRLAVFNLLPLEHRSPAPPPEGEDWGDLLRRCSSPGGRVDFVALRDEMNGWVGFLVSQGRFDEAQRISRVLEVLSTCPLSTSMAADMAFLTLEEGLDLA